MGLLSGPDDVFAARPARRRGRLLAPLLGLLVGAVLALVVLHWVGPALPAWPWLRPAIVLVAALGCAALLHRLATVSRR